MKIHIFASGSGGNSLLISENNTAILIDAGISMRRISQGVCMAGIKTENVMGVLITHEHSDHVKGLYNLVKRYKIPVYAPAILASALIEKLDIPQESVVSIPVNEPFIIGSMKVSAFRTSHDVSESVGYRVESGKTFALATDTGIVTDEIFAGLKGADTVLIEANHDVQRLKEGPYPPFLKARILSDRGHLSNDNCAALAAKLAKEGTRQIILGHLSKTNNTPDLACAAVARALEDFRCVKLSCAMEDTYMETEV